jgi:hypothetical protein
MELYAGLDRSGTANLAEAHAHRNFYVVCLVAVEDREALRYALAEVRQQFGMKASDEFSGHDIGDKVQLEFLKAAHSVGLRVGALIIDKAATNHIHGGANLPSTAEFQLLTSWVLLKRFFALHTVAGLWCDEDIKGKERQQEFTTEVKRIYRTYQPGKRVHVRHIASEAIDLIQVADIVGYGLARVARGGVIQPEIRKILEGMRKETGNVIMGPMAWERTQGE